MRRLTGVELLIIDDFALQPLDPTQTADFYELCVERHQRAATVVTSNRTPEEWLSMMADPLLAQSAVDRLASTAHELVIEGESYRHRQKPAIHPGTTPACPLTSRTETTMLTHDPRWSLPRGNTLVPSRWQATEFQYYLYGQWPRWWDTSRQGSGETHVGRCGLDRYRRRPTSDRASEFRLSTGIRRIRCRSVTEGSFRHA